ncbi:MAG: patatin-like phospholipase family protein, partial [Muribaculaceae bacterium]|nr:patatin-like phospholipase family protein [Muribaculaceae bacterium]
MDNELNIGMTFSGGGYRAATFDLGALSFLNSIRLDDGRTLLDCVTALTSVSGGTIPAMKYMLARARGQQVDDMVNELYDFLCNEDLMTHVLKQLSDEKANREASSIKIMAGIYDRLLFDNATMGDIIDNFDRIPVKDYTALATDFDNSLPFRFRLTEGRMTDGARMTYGVFGNQRHSIGRSVVRHITPGEALACSSCFPSGFEPMMYPDDFRVAQDPDLAGTINMR